MDEQMNINENEKMEIEKQIEMEKILQKEIDKEIEKEKEKLKSKSQKENIDSNREKNDSLENINTINKGKTPDKNINKEKEEDNIENKEKEKEQINENEEDKNKMKEIEEKKEMNDININEEKKEEKINEEINTEKIEIKEKEKEKEEDKNEMSNMNNINKINNQLSTDNNCESEEKINYKIEQLTNSVKILDDKFTKVEKRLHYILKILLEQYNIKDYKISQSREMVNTNKENEEKKYLQRKTNGSEITKIKEEDEKKITYERNKEDLEKKRRIDETEESDYNEDKIVNNNYERQKSKEINISNINNKQRKKYRKLKKIKKRKKKEEELSEEISKEEGLESQRVYDPKEKNRENEEESNNNISNIEEEEEKEINKNEEMDEEKSEERIKQEEEKTEKKKRKKLFKYYFDGHIINNKKIRWEVQVKQLKGWFSLGISERRKTSETNEKQNHSILTVDKDFILKQINFLMANDRCTILWENGQNKVTELKEQCFKIKEGDNLVLIYSPKFKQLKIYKKDEKENEDINSYIIENINYSKSQWLVPCAIYSKKDDKAIFKNFQVLADYNK